jgi:prepilin-type processing-associated H-X9-DG protein
MAIGLAQYAKDYNDHLPPLAFRPESEVKRIQQINKKRSWEKQLPVPPFGWADGIQPYVKSVCLLNCPSEHSSPNGGSEPNSQGYTDYWLNALVSGRQRAAVNSANVIMNGDGTGNDQSSDARYNKSALPASLAQDTTDAERPQSAWPLRHFGGANYSFVDGHVKWLRPYAVSASTGADYTFAP